MSLLRQLIWSVSIALLAILLGALVLNAQSARSYLSEQLSSQSESAVSSLALMLSQPASQDAVTQELLMSALYDTGQFAAIRMTAPDGNKVFERQQPSDAAQRTTPGWFQQLLPLPLAKAQRAVSNGWSQLGTVEVVVDNRLAQAALWQSSVRLVLLVVVAGLAWAVFVGSLLRWFRRVLRDEIAQQVQCIGTGQGMDAQPDTVHVQELRAVSSAIQDAHARVQKTERAQQQQIESLVLESHRDALTGLANRKYFVNELHKALQLQEPAQGHVMLVRQRDLQVMNVCMARKEVDEWLQNLAQQVQQLLAGSSVQHAQLARLNGSDFALLLPGEMGPQAMHLIQQVRSLMQSLSVALGDGQWSRWAFVVTPYLSSDSVEGILSRVDQGLMQAESAGHGDVEFAEPQRHDAASMQPGEGHWQQLLKMALHTPGQLALNVKAQQHASAQNTEQWSEAELQLKDAQGKVMDAAVFLPAALRLGLSDEFDLHALALGLQWLEAHRQGRVVVRVSLASLEHPTFAQRALQVLRQPQWAQVVERLVVEIDAYALERCTDAVLHFGRAMQAQAIGMGLRRLDQAPKALLHMPSLTLRYVKLGGYLASQSMHNMGSKALLEAMINTAHAQTAQVYVMDHVDSKVAQWLRQLGVYLAVPST